MTKRKFRIEGGNRGGELTIGTVTKEFVEFFLGADSDADLISHLQSYEWEDDEMRIEGAPPPIDRADDYQPPWNEIDDIEHLNQSWADGGFTVTEVKYISDDDESYGDDIGEEVGAVLSIVNSAEVS